MKPTPYKCPYCGWTYNPNEYDMGYDLVPHHNIWQPGQDSCPGSKQHPRNADSDRRPRWRDEKDHG